MKGKDLVILGAGESGVGAAILAKKNGYRVWVSDRGIVPDHFRKELDSNQIDWEENKHSMERILQADEVVKSPGIPDHIPIIQQIREQGIPVISEIEFASRFTNATLIGITGSNGKTTTTLLIHHILKSAGIHVGIAGNIGDSFAKSVAENDYEYFVLELSSFQLDGIENFRPHIAVITNITPDHLDRYDHSFEAYRNSKFRIAKNQRSTDYLIFDADDVAIQEGLKHAQLQAKKIPYAKDFIQPEGTYIKDNQIHSTLENNHFMIPIQSLSLKGQHNAKNAMAAATVAQLIKIRKQTLKDCLENFQGASHRLENVLTINKVNYINDSKATNVNATFYALDSMTSSTVWIVGGIDKGNDYEPLLPLVREKVKAIICLGNDNVKLIDVFAPVSELMVETNSMSEAVKIAYKIASSGENVLLSPACASFDLFENYEDRGNQFKEAVRKL
jgi:UDP-N-acetylmuramoylalanine--D-glutamate ligase